MFISGGVCQDRKLDKKHPLQKREIMMTRNADMFDFFAKYYPEIYIMDFYNLTVGAVTR